MSFLSRLAQTTLVIVGCSSPSLAHQTNAGAEPVASHRDTAADFANAEKEQGNAYRGSFFAQFSMQTALTGNWKLTTAYIYWRRPPAVPAMTPVYVLRAVSGTFREGPTIRWTSSEICPAMREVLGEAMTLKPPSFNFPGLTPSKVTSVMLDGATFRISSNSTFSNGGWGWLSFSGNYDTPLADWYLSTQKRLELCWRNDQSSLP